MSNKTPVSASEMDSIRLRAGNSVKCFEDVYIDRRILLGEIDRLNQVISDLESQLNAKNRALAVTTQLLAKSPKRQSCTKSSLRNLLYTLFKTDADICEFAYDKFEKTVNRFSNGMSRGGKVTLLLKEHSQNEIINALETFCGNEFEKQKHLLEFIDDDE